MAMSSCDNDEDRMDTILSSYVLNNIFETGAVIACAASDETANSVLTFFYPEPGSLNTRLYQTKAINVDENNYSNYTEVLIDSEPIFNGYLRRFTQESTSEKWIIVTFELNGEIKISNPIRSKQITKPTLWNDDVTINLAQPLMPIFSWQNNLVGDNAIYFQIVSDADDNLLSGTYTYENQFQYYKLDNVVLNVTRGNAQNLESRSAYNFTLMDVSLDNWVNVVTLNKSFITE
jgi:hypothetical protein